MDNISSKDFNSLIYRQIGTTFLSKMFRNYVIKNVFIPSISGIQSRAADN